MEINEQIERAESMGKIDRFESESESESDTKAKAKQQCSDTGSRRDVQAARKQSKQEA